MQKWKSKGDRKATTEIEGMIFTNSRKQIGRQSLKEDNFSCFTCWEVHEIFKAELMVFLQMFQLRTKEKKSKIQSS